jgi:hypothetical protein
MSMASLILCLLVLTLPSYLGKSTGAGSLSLRVHSLKDIAYIPDFKSKIH